MIANIVERDYRLAQWAEVIQERIESGLTVNEFCKLRGLTRDKYYYWQAKLKEAACEHLLQARPQIQAAQGFAEVVVTSATLAPFEPKSKNDNNGELRIELSGIHINADAGYPPTALAALLKELLKPC
jgi:hypothetical protein